MNKVEARELAQRVQDHRGDAMTEIEWTDEARPVVALLRLAAAGGEDRSVSFDGLDARALLDGIAAREAQAAVKAWDEGKSTGWSRAMRYMSDEPKVDINPPNPYRIERGESS